MAATSVRARIERRDPFWPAQLTVLIAIALGLALPSQLTLGTPWVVPGVETVLLLGLILAIPRLFPHHHPLRRPLRMGLVGIVSAVNVASLFLLAQSLLEGTLVSGRTLLEGGAILWLTTILLFGVWFWELDRGGPLRRMKERDRRPDFLFPEMEEEAWLPADWQPRMSDYLYLSLTNAASFSPPETFPLTRAAKILMSLQTLGSLTTLTVVLAYAVGNLR
jgi:hypothetical protein